MLYVAYNQSNSQSETKYCLPPDEILQLADAKPRPLVRIDDKAEYIVLLERTSMYKSLQELAEKEYKLAGLRINPRNFNQSRVSYIQSVQIKNIKLNQTQQVKGFPQDALLGGFQYSPDQTKMACYNNTGNSLDLWIIDILSASATKIEGIALNMVLGRGIQWMDNSNLLVKTVSLEKDQLLLEEPLPNGPIVQESKGVKAPNRTYQDMLKNPVDEQNFEYFVKSDLVKVDLKGVNSPILKNQMFQNFGLSPDKKYILVHTIQRPYSYQVPYSRFAANYSVFNTTGDKVFNLADIPLTEEMSISFDAVSKGVRDVLWRSDVAATLVWAEALDEGDPAIDIAYRDAIFLLEAPFTSPKKEIAKTVNRLTDIHFGNKSIVVFSDYLFKNRNTKTYFLDLGAARPEMKVIWDRNSEDIYSDPGNFMLARNEFNAYSLLFSPDKKKIFLTGEGYSAEGNRPFVDEYQLESGKTKRIWQADGISTYEQVIDFVDVTKNLILTSIESKTDNPNFYLRTIGSKKAPVKITDFPHPYESFKAVHKEKIKYKRADGIDLSATLYLPPAYDIKSGTKLPLIMWAYPREFKSSDAAGQVSSSPNEFTYLNHYSPVYWVMKGYAILDDADFPIVGEGNKEPNDTYIPQLISNAKAAIDKLDSMGCINRAKVAVGGHSYGAFMTANLLTHSTLFACGVARSGAYNRTLTPFSFQSEERSYWQVPEVYNQMSPFTYADSIKYPILLIHGNADNNSGTFTLQSERYFQALKGNGKVARLVLLPHESHGYVARENVMHVLWEQNEWFEKYLKNQ